ENCTLLSGGVKRDVLPPNFRDYIRETLNIADHNFIQSYGMQEVNLASPRCSEGRYHLPPWVVPMLLDEPGENLLEPPATGEIEGRVGLLDMSVEGRWGGVISGDKARISWDRCKCGHRSPSVHPEITRYANQAGGDKITCAGSIDAYVRGI